MLRKVQWAGKDLAGAGVVVATALAASLAGLLNEFVQDDIVLIANNARIHHLANWRELLTLPYWPPPWLQDLYRPVTSLLLSLEFELGGGAPLVYRIASYLLYAATALGVFLLARRLLPLGIAIGVGCLFAAHPVHVEAVALGVGQNELLVCLLALLMTSRYLKWRASPSGLTSARWGALGVIYLAASLTKETGLVLPGLLVAAEFCLLAGPARERLKRLAPGYGFLAALAGLVLLARAAVFSGGVAGSFTAEALQGLSLGARALTMLKVVLRWAHLLVWPSHLQADYTTQEITGSTHLGVAEVAGLLLVLAALAAAWVARRRAPTISFGLAWAAVALLPVSNVLVPTGVVVAERTLFLPSVGVILAAGGGVALLWQTILGRQAVWRWAFAVSCAGLVVAGVTRSAIRHRSWKSERIYSLQIGHDAPRSYRAQKAYGYALFESGQRPAAMEAYRRAIALAPANLTWTVRNDLARRYWEAGENQLAVDQLQTSLIESPDQEETRNYLVLGYLALGDYREAARQATVALARGASPKVFTGLRALADSAAERRAPPGSIRVQIVPAGPPD